MYLAAEERTGKSLTALAICEQSSAKTILIVTKKGKPLEGWKDTILNYETKKDYTVINYHSVDKIEGSFDLIVLDESHNYISGYPKHSKLWVKVRKKTAGKLVVYVSATPYAQGPQMLYSQLALSSYSPWRSYSTFYGWHRHYGIPSLVYLAGRSMEKYDKCRSEEVLAAVSHLFVSRTRKQCGFKQEPVDKLHYIELSDKTKLAYNTLVKHKIIEYADHEEPLVCDTSMKLRTSLHMLEGGVAKIHNDYVILRNTEKVDYILATWGDVKDLAIMYHYKAERTKLEKHFKNALLLQATTNAEGIDLYDTEHLVIYSQDFSTAKHTQRRARQANSLRKEDIVVNFILVKEAISDQVYTTVSLNKQNFVDKFFNGGVI